MYKITFKTYFKRSWLQHSDFKEWLLEDIDKEKFKLKWCYDTQSFSLSNMGIQALKHNSTSKRHIKSKE